MDVRKEALGYALERRIVEGEDEVPEPLEPGGLMVFMDPVHAFECSDPRRVADLEGSVGVQPSGRKRMPPKRLVVRRPEEVRGRAHELDNGRWLAAALVVHHADRRAVPVGVARLDEVREEQRTLGGEDDWKRRADGRLRGVRQLGDFIAGIDAVHTS